MLKLYILRHGKAQKPNPQVQDFDRQLNRKGAAQVNQIGYLLSNQEHGIQQIISSGAQRTTETAEIMNHFLKTQNIHFDNNLYLTDHQSITKKLITFATEDTVLYVGHNFGISDFVTYLTGQPILMVTSMLIEINLNINSWSELSANTGKIVQIKAPNVHAF